MLRRLVLTSSLVLATMLLVVPAAGSHEEPHDPPTEHTDSTDATTSSNERLPGTSLEAEERDDGSTSAAPWVVGSGIAALAAVGLGGWLLQRRAG